MKLKYTALIMLFIPQIFSFSQSNNWTIYNTTNTPQTGPCNGEIIGVAQDNESNLWFSTTNGVTRFDGQNWISYFADNENGGDNTYQNIKINSKNRVYLASYSWGGGFALINNERIELIDYMHVFDMDIDSNDIVWLATYTGLKKYDGTKFIDLSTEHEMLNEFTGAVHVDKNNHIWTGTYNGVLFYNDTVWQHFTTEDGLLDNFVFYIESDSENNIWMMNTLGFSKFDGRIFTNYVIPDSIRDFITYGMTIGSDNTLYVSTENSGIFLFKNNSYSFLDVSTGLKTNFVLSCFEDVEQNLWIGYHGYGVDKYNGSEFINFTGNGLNTINELRFYRNKLWIGSMSGGLTIYDGETWENHNISNGFISNLIKDMDMDSQENIWISTIDGITKFNGTGFTNITNEEGLPANLTNSICLDNEDHIWVGTVHNGVAKYDGENWTYFNPSNSMVGKNVSEICQDTDNIMWFGSANNEGLLDGLILRYDGESWESFRPINGLVSSILQDSKENIWFGYFGVTTNKCVAKYNGNIWETFSLPFNGISNIPVFDIYEDADGVIWFGRGYNGCTTFDGENWINHTSDDGFPQTSNRALMQDADGNMWIGSYLKGLYKLNKCTNITEPIDFKTINEFSAYPNPVYDYFTIQSNKEYITPKTAQLYTIDGKLLKENVFHFDLKMDIESLPSGIYILNISNRFYNYTEKIVKK